MYVLLTNFPQINKYIVPFSSSCYCVGFVFSIYAHAPSLLLHFQCISVAQLQLVWHVYYIVLSWFQ